MNVAFVAADDNWEKDKDFLEFSRKVNKTIRDLEKSQVHVRAVTAISSWGRPCVMLGYDTPEDMEEMNILATAKIGDITKNVMAQFGMGGPR